MEFFFNVTEVFLGKALNVVKRVAHKCCPGRGPGPRRSCDYTRMRKSHMLFILYNLCLININCITTSVLFHVMRSGSLFEQSPNPTAQSSSSSRIHGNFETTNFLMVYSGSSVTRWSILTYDGDTLTTHTSYCAKLSSVFSSLHTFGMTE